MSLGSLIMAEYRRSREFSVDCDLTRVIAFDNKRMKRRAQSLARKKAMAVFVGERKRDVSIDRTVVNLPADLCY